MLFFVFVWWIICFFFNNMRRIQVKFRCSMLTLPSIYEAKTPHLNSSSSISSRRSIWSRGSLKNNSISFMLWYSLLWYIAICIFSVINAAVWLLLLLLFYLSARLSSRPSESRRPDRSRWSTVTSTTRGSLFTRFSLNIDKMLSAPLRKDYNHSKFRKKNL